MRRVFQWLPGHHREQLAGDELLPGLVEVCALPLRGAKAGRLSAAAQPL